MGMTTVLLSLDLWVSRKTEQYIVVKQFIKLDLLVLENWARLGQISHSEAPQSVDIKCCVRRVVVGGNDLGKCVLICKKELAGTEVYYLNM